MLEIIAALTMLFWTLGLFSGAALGAAVYVLPLVAVTAIGLRVYDSVHNRTPEHSLPRKPASTPAHSPQPVPTTRSGMPERAPAEHARAA